MKKRPDQMEADLKAKIEVARSKLAEAIENLKLPPQSAANLRAKIKVAQVQLAETEENLKRPAQREADIQAQIDIAKSEAKQARRNSSRTTILAPMYHGRITEKRVDIGQVVTTGTVLATAIATDYAEVRLPISNQRLAYLDVPEQLVNTNNTQAPKHQEPLTRPLVTLTTEIGTKAYKWEGWIDRAESRYDSASQQLFLIAQVDEPYGRKPALRAGLFVRADITGKTLDNVYILPRRAVRRGNEVALAENRFTQDKTGSLSISWNISRTILTRKEIEVLWSDEKEMITRSLKPNDVLIIDPIDYATNEQELIVHVKGETAPKTPGPPKGKGGPGKGKSRYGKGKGKPKG